MRQLHGQAAPGQTLLATVGRVGWPARRLQEGAKLCKVHNGVDGLYTMDSFLSFRSGPISDSVKGSGRTTCTFITRYAPINYQSW